MEVYDGTEHPEVWIEKVKSYCYQKDITIDNENILNYCKTLIHPSIYVDEAESFEELVEILKSDIITFEFFKNFTYKKLKNLQFKYTNDNEILKFLNNFQQLCYEAEINEFEEQKKLFLETLPTYSIQNKFILNNFEKINSMKELMNYFNQSLLLKENTKEIKNGSCVTLKHVATGKYLSSSDDVYYNTGSESQAVYARETFLAPDSVWIINMGLTESHDPIFYGTLFYLTHKSDRKRLDVDKTFQSPTTKYSEVTVINTSDKRMQMMAVKITINNSDNYVRSGNIIYLRNSESITLRSHERTFTIDNKTYQEVIGHNEPFGENDKWCIELIED
ncbi:hypothetical protein C1645_856556 [Glomus cerebriforme]|uniref:MIR domain-containing protein n=1 Tax=Glomus cerebriforme TaxID=658196 RepID=A0A397STJ5_9GLOM|nr:hypothetical protein C1645_856556 [Glomus cerebriforme]